MLSANVVHILPAPMAHSYRLCTYMLNYMATRWSFWTLPYHAGALMLRVSRWIRWHSPPDTGLRPSTLVLQSFCSRANWVHVSSQENVSNIPIEVVLFLRYRIYTFLVEYLRSLNETSTLRKPSTTYCPKSDCNAAAISDVILNKLKHF